MIGGTLERHLAEAALRVHRIEEGIVDLFDDAQLTGGVLAHAEDDGITALAELLLRLVPLENRRMYLDAVARVRVGRPLLRGDRREAGHIECPFKGHHHARPLKRRGNGRLSGSKRHQRRGRGDRQRQFGDRRSSLVGQIEFGNFRASLIGQIDLCRLQSERRRRRHGLRFHRQLRDRRRSWRVQLLGASGRLRSGQPRHCRVRRRRARAVPPPQARQAQWREGAIGRREDRHLPIF